MLEMSSNQTLSISQQDFAILAPSWQAGISGPQCLPKSLKNIDVESVSIGKTCEKLSLALNENVKYIRGDPQTVDDNGKQCAVQKSNISFRNFSNIWFGALKIYQQQVNTLFRLSQDLLSRSSNYEGKSAEARKRNSSVTSYKLIKKRRLTLSELCEESFFATNYTKLLDELEKLAREPTSLPLPEETQNITGTITQYQIREITLREISTTTFISSDDLNEDCGFGEATHEEIAEFFNFVGGGSIKNTKKITLKRKPAGLQESPIKKRCFKKDDFAEPMNNENLTFDEHLLKKSHLKRPASPKHCLYYYEDTKPYNVGNDGIFEAAKIKKETISNIEKTTTIHCEKTSKRRKLIIDDCIKIDMTDVVAAMKNSKIYTKHIRNRHMKSFQTKRNTLAFELLTRFNRRSLRLSLSLKKKIVISREQFKRDYINLLREIFKTNYKEEWSSEIYPKWINFGNGQLKQNNQQRLNKSKSHKTFAIQPETDVCNFQKVLTTNFAYNDNFEEVPTLDVNNNKMDLLTANIYDEWRPYGVMLKLLNLWRSNQTNRIAAYKLFKLASNQIGRGLGFNSLLHLSKKRFVSLTKYPESIELQNIEVHVRSFDMWPIFLLSFSFFI